MGDEHPYKKDRGPLEILKRTPRRYQDPFLWAWLKKCFPPERYKYLQYRSKVSYHLLSRFSRDESCFTQDVSCFSRDPSCFSQESVKHSVWHILRIRNWTCKQLQLCSSLALFY